MFARLYVVGAALHEVFRSGRPAATETFNRRAPLSSMALATTQITTAAVGGVALTPFRLLAAVGVRS